MQPLRRIAVLIGSSRHGGNGAGLAAWVSTLLDRRLNASTKSYEIVTVNPTVAPLPLGPVLEGARMPAQVPNASSYASSNVQKWSTFASSCSAFAIVSPEYNSGYPGELKNAIDHLYKEWLGKPVLLVTYGAGGGFRCADQLRTIFIGLKMPVVEDAVNIRLPPEFVGGEQRVLPEQKFPEFLSPYEEQTNSAADHLKVKLT
ncbi:hypothetical protein NM688_g7408 [Phlebia brevispora]|uniref:Uncharacterized protein n=1 Tax=Phlebia brevispora TaxID=194682 RepID=A0ACC1S5L4_9APHY|nr:hypothetical protein NM688_g7408 [Phlebia brevispora]